MNKKRIEFLIMIIAVIAVIGCLWMACDSPGGSDDGSDGDEYISWGQSQPTTVLKELSGKLYVEPSGRVTIGTPLVAHYEGKETVELKYMWVMKSGFVNSSVSSVDMGREDSYVRVASGSAYTPDKEGIYKAAVYASSYNRKYSAPVTVTP